MRDIADLIVTQYRIFAPDLIPMRQCSTLVGTNALMGMLAFKSSGINQENGDLTFQGGTLAREAQEPVWIVYFHINERRIIIRVLGSSEDANDVFAVIATALVNLSGRGPSGILEPMFITEETMCAVTLGFDWKHLFSESLVAFANETLLSALVTDDAKPFLKAPSLRIHIWYYPSEHLLEQGAQVADKVLVIEPRVDRPLTERRYFTMSPVGSSAHSRLLTQLETAIKRKKKSSS